MWLDLFTDITGHLNHFNSQLQGKIQLISDLFNTVRAFLAKLLLFKTQLAKGDFLHFPTCKELSPANETIRKAQRETYVAYVEKLELEFDGRFSQLKKDKQIYQLFIDPFSVSPEDAEPHLQLELIKLQCLPILKKKHRESPLLEFYHSLD